MHYESIKLIIKTNLLKHEGNMYAMYKSCMISMIDTHIINKDVKTIGKDENSYNTEMNIWVFKMFLDIFSKLSYY